MAQAKPKKEKVVVNFLKEIKDADDINKLKPLIREHINEIFNSLPEVSDKYDLLFLFDNARQIRDYSADQIYKSVKSLNGNKDILLLISSNGGNIEPAYLISKVCKEYAYKHSKKFNVVIPRKAKSAATLICLGADEIHMGSMSQLGPIDPQIGGLPALGLGNAVEYLANLTKRYTEASEMLARYLSYQLDLQTLGYFERVSESAAQYAEKLLEGKSLPKEVTSQSVATALVYLYKHHSFVIDKEEAKKYLGEMIQVDSNEYVIADKIQEFLEEVDLITHIFQKHDLSVVGSLDGLFFFEIIERN